MGLSITQRVKSLIDDIKTTSTCLEFSVFGEEETYHIFIPDVELYHYESKSRGIDKDPKAVERFMSEVNYAKENYAKWLVHDPFYNDNFDKNYDYMLIVGTGSN